eukprot:TRINITY_DN77781_c0_g1_i1.p1 TRINITY_DN77781_c0_g1~~TRINITY_DN77781_c0_g1_i1.p1  ORF type:complete len:370 (+),score=85.48 TRINITY_DN77781_c0_g1_i1:52-1161(+)
MAAEAAESSNTPAVSPEENTFLVTLTSTENEHSNQELSLSERGGAGGVTTSSTVGGGGGTAGSGEYPVRDSSGRQRSSRTPDIPTTKHSSSSSVDSDADQKESKITKFMKMLTGASQRPSAPSNATSKHHQPNHHPSPTAGRSVGGGSGAGGAKKGLSRHTIACEMLDIHLNFSKVLNHVIEVYVNRLEQNSSCMESSALRKSFGALKVMRRLEDNFIEEWQYRLSHWCEDILLAELLEQHLCSEEYKGTFVDWYDAVGQTFEDIIRVVSGDLMLKKYFYDAHKKNSSLDLELFASYPSSFLQQILSFSAVLLKKTELDHPDVEILQRVVADYADFSPKVCDLMHQHQIVNPVTAVITSLTHSGSESKS